MFSYCRLPNLQWKHNGTKLTGVKENVHFMVKRFAVFVEPDAYEPRELKPSFSAMIKHEKSKKPDKPADSGREFLKPAVQKLTAEVRLMRLKSELDALMESDD